MYDYGIFIFRRDLRIKDNITLNELTKNCKKIIPIFIFDTNQIIKHNKSDIHPNGIRRSRALNFIIESLQELDTELDNKLHLFEGEPHIVVESIIKHIGTSSTIIVAYNKDYTEYSLERDKAIKKISPAHLSLDDIAIVYPEYHYKQFAVFYNLHLTKIKNIETKTVNVKSKLVTLKMKQIAIDKYYTKDFVSNYNPLLGGRKNGLKQLKKFTQISGYLNFGCISVREAVIYANSELKGEEKTKFVRSLIWRDYYLALLIYVPESRSYKHHIDPVYDNDIKWRSYKDAYSEWKKMIDCKTGFLLVDASMTQLKQTGFIPNKNRLLLGYFSIKYLRIHPLMNGIGINDWFSEYLMDCVTSQNKLNCQWITELDFSGRRFGKSGTRSGRPFSLSIGVGDIDYIKHWIPECKKMTDKEIKDNKGMFDPRVRYSEWIKATSIKNNTN